MKKDNKVEIRIKWNGVIQKAILHNGKPTQNIPENWGKPKVTSFWVFGGRCSSTLIDIYPNNHYSFYQDGCFWPYTGIIEFI